MNKYFFKKYQIINIAIFSLIAIFFILDRLLKKISLHDQAQREIFKSVFKFSFTANQYIAFSLPIGGLFLIILVGGILLFFLFYLIFLFYKKRYKEFFGFLAVFLGALSNFIDRIVYSFVVDYFDLIYFTVFNLADVLIFLGSIFLIYFYFKDEINKKL